MSARIISMLLSACAVAGAVAVFVAPELERASQQETSDAPAATVNTATPEAEDKSRSRQAVLSIRDDGHYWARTLVNDKASVDFMVDTGASTVALTQEDARKMGFDPERLDYKWEIRTAGGVTYGASVVIDSIKINQVHVKKVNAMVLREDLSQSLLGMSFLRELYSYEFRGDRLIIRQ
ncbi:TIGR02281 family clan AA aspartic protease [Henriciella sp.]|uniref:retropepsin-like aspartic protease family protein n=1 Tax=Henriciella sp. TaxID=1968823 RepID=UPI00262454D0|nr:TIGR02281 family clan AA aspartic protease [Henriciella sp.]